MSNFFTPQSKSDEENFKEARKHEIDLKKHEAVVKRDLKRKEMEEHRELDEALKNIDDEEKKKKPKVEDDPVVEITKEIGKLTTSLAPGKLPLAKTRFADDYYQTDLNRFQSKALQRLKARKKIVKEEFNDNFEFDEDKGTFFNYLKNRGLGFDDRNPRRVIKDEDIRRLKSYKTKEKEIRQRPVDRSLIPDGELATMLRARDQIIDERVKTELGPKPTVGEKFQSTEKKMEQLVSGILLESDPERQEKLKMAYIKQSQRLAEIYDEQKWIYHDFVDEIRREVRDMEKMNYNWDLSTFSSRDAFWKKMGELEDEKKKYLELEKKYDTKVKEGHSRLRKLGIERTGYMRDNVPEEELRNFKYEKKLKFPRK